MLVKLKNEYAKLGVIGSPVAHSLSPVIHNHVISELGLSYIYLAFDVGCGNAKKFMEAAPLMGVTGFNVTMPHKRDIFEAVGETLGDAKAAGSVNTAVLKGDKWLGYSTDGDGFGLSLAEKGIGLKDKRLMVLGAGGASRAVILNAMKSGAKSVTIFNRSAGRARALAEETGAGYGGFTNEELSRGFEEADIVINSTPLGMHGIPYNFESFGFLDSKKEAIVCDLIYNPFKTELLDYAESRGHFTVNGLGMLIYQAILSLELFTGTKIDARGMKSSVEKHLIRNGHIKA